ncbi:MAG: tetratricopeptide repeat-containing glycosyltransferase family protein [Acetobacteraceae bacterium]|nr:tetratricopeptide repeat-containing glycosyltransferase family protein [Acetobacteraceae bacterium]
MTDQDTAEACLARGTARLARPTVDAADIEAAEADFRHALALQPGLLAARRALGDALLSHGNALLAHERLRDAERVYRQAIAVLPSYADAIGNLGQALVAQNRLEEAIGLLRTALVLNPDDTNSHFALACALLLIGETEEGWRRYEIRRQTPSPDTERRPELPRWEAGQDVAGRRVLLMAEQGVGDTIQYLRLAPLLARRAARVVLEVPPVLRAMVGGVPGIAAVVVPEEPAPDCDLLLPMMSLPLCLGYDPVRLPLPVPYLHVPPDRRDAWQDWLGPAEGLRIGLNVSGDYRHGRDRLRSVPLARFAPLFDLPGCRFVLLNPALRETDVPPPSALCLPGPLLRDFADTGALIRQLDLVIAADTGVAHLAAALGRPVWTLLAFAPDFRWRLHAADTPWYPTMKLYRQPQPGDWDAVIAAVRRDLAAWHP